MYDKHITHMSEDLSGSENAWNSPGSHEKELRKHAKRMAEVKRAERLLRESTHIILLAEQSEIVTKIEIRQKINIKKKRGCYCHIQ